MIISIISQGLFWSILGLGIFMTFRILNFPDMTTEGSFPLGGAVAVTLITKGVNPLIATLIAILAGCLAGFAPFKILAAIFPVATPSSCWSTTTDASPPSSTIAVALG